MTLAVTDLGLELRGVSQADLRAAQLMLDYRTPGEVRTYLRPHCGPDQVAAEVRAAAHLNGHVPVDENGTYVDWCVPCSRPWPCPPIAGDLRVLGIYQ